MSGEIHFHTSINIPVVRPVLFHLICDELEGLAHAILRHLFLRLVKLFKLYHEDKVSLLQHVAPKSVLLGLCQQNLLFFCYVLD